MSVTNDAESEPSGESMDASTMAASMRPRRNAGMAWPTKYGNTSSFREMAGAPCCA